MAKFDIKANKLSDLTSEMKDLQFLSWAKDKEGNFAKNDKGLYTAKVVSINSEVTFSVKTTIHPDSMQIKKGDNVDLVGNVFVNPYASNISSNPKTGQMFASIDYSITGDKLEKVVQK